MLLLSSEGREALPTELEQSLVLYFLQTRWKLEKSSDFLKHHLVHADDTKLQQAPVAITNTTPSPLSYNFCIPSIYTGLPSMTHQLTPSPVPTKGESSDSNCYHGDEFSSSIWYYNAKSDALLQRYRI